MIIKSYYDILLSLKWICWGATAQTPGRAGIEPRCWVLPPSTEKEEITRKVFGEREKKRNERSRREEKIGISWTFHHFYMLF
jgi:hypothetical protein